MAKHILIVEDEKPMAHALELKLQKEGFETQHANNGKEARSALDVKSFDLVLMDLIMPEMDGFTLLEKIKEEKDLNVPVIVLSNLSQSEDKEKVLDLGAEAYYIKSDITIAEIVDEVRQILGKDAK